MSVTALTSVPAADATFAGSNGKISFLSLRPAPGNTATFNIFHVFAMEPDGSAPSLVDYCPGGGPPCAGNRPNRSAAVWSPDGSQLALSTEVGGALYVLNADGSGFTQLAPALNQGTMLPGGVGGQARAPSWSPDGERIAFSACVPDFRGRCNQFDLYTMRADGTDVTRLTSGAAAAGPAWSPDGSEVAFTTDSTIMAVTADGLSLRGLYTTSCSSFASLGRPDWSPDGHKIVLAEQCFNPFPQPADPSEVVAVNSDGTGGRVQLTSGVNDGSQPVWSPDGHKIAFTSTRDGDDGEIYVMDADGTNQTNLTNSAPNDYSGASLDELPSWQPLSANPDRDGDGVQDAVDADGGSGSGQPGAFSDDTGNGKTTTGRVVDAAGTTVAIEDVADPKGVRITISGTGGPAQLTVCPAGFDVEVPIGSSLVVTCGSVTVDGVTGHPVVVKLPGGVARVEVPPAAAATIDTGTGGTFSITQVTGTVTLTLDGTSREVTGPVTGASWHFAGFAQPVDVGGVLNVVNSGQAVPLKWRLTAASGTPVTNLTTATVTTQLLTCASGAQTDQIEEVVADASALKNLGNGNYQLNWKTPKTYANSCRTLALDIGDGVQHKALFKFPK